MMGIVGSEEACLLIAFTACSNEQSRSCWPETWFVTMERGGFPIMMNNILLTSAALLCMLAVSPSRTYGQATSNARIAVVNIQDAIARIQEGQELAKDLKKKYGPTEVKLRSLQGEIQSLGDQINRGLNTMSEEARRKMAREMQLKERELTRATEDARAEFGQAQQQALNELSGKLMTVIDKYSKENNIGMVFDVSSPQSPIIYAVNEFLITNDVIELYDNEHPVAAVANPPAD
jgi:Skp family chaperone for outer membrane proteins